MKKSILLLILIISSIQLFAQIPTNGLIGYYPFTGNANDSSGKGNHGTVYGATLTKDRFGKNNCAYNFVDSNSHYIQIPTTDLLNNTYTYSLWANLTSMPDNGDIGFAFDIGGYAGDQSINIQNNYLGSSTGWGGGGYNTTSPNYPLQQYTNPSAGQWYHLLTVRDSNQMKLYINGILKDSVGTGSNRTPFYGSGSITAKIGIRNNGSAPFNGKIDDIRLYNRALSKSEITALSNEKALGLSALKVNSPVNIYPNPANKFIQVNFTNFTNSDDHNLRIINTLGQVVLTTVIRQELSHIDLSSVDVKGIYFIQISDSRNMIIHHQKIVLE